MKYDYPLWPGGPVIHWPPDENDATRAKIHRLQRAAVDISPWQRFCNDVSLMLRASFR